MVVSTGDLPTCQRQFLFFDAHGGEAHRIQPPPGFSMEGAGCFDGAVAVAGTIANAPVLVKQDDRTAPVGEQLTFFPFTNGSWDRPCRIKLSYSIHFKTTAKFCRRGIDCDQMKRLSHVLYDRFNRDISVDNPVVDGVAADLPRPLSEIASRFRELDRIPTFAETSGDTGHFSAEHGSDAGSNATQVLQVVPVVSTHFRHQLLYPLDLGNSVGISAIGPAASARGALDGLLMSIWAVSGDTLSPLAGFQLRSQRGKAVSVAIDMP